MKKTISVTLNSLIFTLEEDAYNRLRTYLDEIREYFIRIDSKKTATEIISDIEASIAEKFSAKLSAKKQVINLKDVERLIKIMGTVTDIASGESNGREYADNDSYDKQKEKDNLKQKKLYRDLDDAVVAGVCSGLGRYFGVDAIIFRLIFALSIFFGGAGVVAYLVFWLVMPPAKTTSQKLEMQGAPVTLKKLEDFAKDKAEKLKQVDTGGIKRVFMVPFIFLNAVFRAFGVFFRTFGRLIGVLIGVLVIIGAAFAMTATGLAAAVAVFNSDTLMIANNFTVAAAVGYGWYLLGIVSGFMVIFIPLVFILLLGISLGFRKSVFNAAINSLFIGAWMIAIISLGVVLVDTVPRLRAQVDEIIPASVITKNYAYEGIDSLRIGAYGNATVEKGDEFSLKITGAELALDNLKFNADNGELKITEAGGNKGFCIFCPDQPVKIEIVTPELAAFVGFQGLTAEIKGFNDADMKVNAGEASRIKVYAQGGTLTNYIAGTGGRVEIVGSPDTLNTVLEGFGQLTARELDAGAVSINGSVLSRIYLGGTAGSLKAELEGSSRLEAFELEVQAAEIKATAHARAEINPQETLTAIAENDARITYSGEPPSITEKAYNNARIEKFDDYRSGEDDIND